MVVKTSNGDRGGVTGAILTFGSFVGACALVPALYVCYLGVQLSRFVWVGILSNRFPHLEFVKTNSVRSLVDSKRNPGVIDVLLEVKGVCDPKTITQNILVNLVQRQDKFGRACFPRLRSVLVSCWGTYAWMNHEKFHLNNHVIIAPTNFRRRPVSELNIQEYVSEMVAKYMPSDISPWQIIIIPNIFAVEEKYYVLVRMHHLLLHKENHLCIGDFLMLTTTQQQSDNNPEKQQMTKTAKSPLLDLFRMPTAIPNLYQRMRISLSNTWNEFIYDYDPLEAPQKSNPGMFQAAAISLIVFVSVVRDFDKCCVSGDPAATFKYFILLIRKECHRRNVNVSLFLNSILVTFDPRNIILSAIKWTWWASIVWSLKVPVLIYHEVAALWSCIFFQYCTHPNTAVSFLHNYLPLMYGALTEIIYVSKIVYFAPRQIIQDVFSSKDDPPHRLQTISLCGRKVVSWSHPVPMQVVRQISKNASCSETEVFLSAVSGCIREYFRENDLEIPRELNTTTRNISEEFIFSNNPTTSLHKSNIGGVVCLKLPLTDPEQVTSLENLKMLQRNISTSRSRQAALYFISMAQTKNGLFTKVLPSVVTKLILNYLSRKYAVTITELAPQHNAAGKIRTTQWGHEVTSVIYWRPPQSNISLSITLQVYGDAVRMGIMTDAQLSPHHIAMASRWTRQISLLAEATGMPKAKPPIPQIMLSPSSPSSERSEDSWDETDVDGKNPEDMLYVEKPVLGEFGT